MMHTRFRFCLPLLLILAGVTPLLAEPGPPASPPATPERMLGDQFVLMMRRVLVGRGSPRPDQLQRARLLMEQALQLEDDDATLWRLRAQLARQMNEPDARLDALRQYLRLAPEDDAAQLALIRARMSGIQTIDGRLQVMKNILESGSASRLGHPLRSRLASMAAAAAHELGNQKQFRHWLTRALALDSTNVTAARMAFDLARSRQAGAVDVGVTAANLVRAAPASARARVTLARVLLNQGAYQAAAVQYDTAMTLTRRPLFDEDFAGWALGLAGAGQPDDALNLLRRLAGRPTGGSSSKNPETGSNPPSRADRASTSPPQAEAGNAPVLPANLEVVRLAVLHAAGRDQAARRSFSRLRRTLTSPSRNPSPSSASPEQGQGKTKARMEGQGNAERAPTGGMSGGSNPGDLAWIGAVFGHQLERVRGWMGETSPEEDPLARRARGWLNLHRGDEQQARELLKPIAQSDGYAALGLAVLSDQESQRAQALRGVFHQWAGRVPGLLAASRLRKMGRKAESTAAGTALTQYMGRFPRQLWAPALEVAPWLSLNLSVPKGRFHPFEPVPVRVTLRNASRMPLTLASSGGLPSRLLVSIQPQAGGKRMKPPQPLIEEAGRRLRLMPDARVHLTLRLDRAGLGTMLARKPTRSFTFSVRTLLGPRIGRGGRWIHGPVGARETLSSLNLAAAPATEENLDQWIETARQDSPVRRLRALARLVSIIDQLPEEAAGPDPRRRIAQTVNEQYGQLKTLGRAWTVRFLSGSETSRRLLDRVYEQAQRSREPRVRLVYLAQVVEDADAPSLTSAMRSRRKTIQQFARAVRNGLKAGNEAGTSDQEETGNPPGPSDS